MKDNNFNNDINSCTVKQSKGDIAEALFREGYNCSQAVAGAFAEEMGLEFKTAVKMVSGFGAGFGRMREVCGAVSGMIFVAGMIKGYDFPSRGAEKAELYKVVQKLMNEYKEQNGSYICRELLGAAGKDTSYIPSERTEEYYKKRPCPKLVRCAAEIVASEFGF